MANNIVKIGMIQMNVLFSEPDKNIQHASELVKSAKAKGVQICVLPECLDLGWGNPEASSLAEPQFREKSVMLIKKLLLRIRYFLLQDLQKENRKKFTIQHFLFQMGERSFISTVR